MATPELTLYLEGASKILSNLSPAVVKEDGLELMYVTQRLRISNFFQGEQLDEFSDLRQIVWKEISPKEILSSEEEFRSVVVLGDGGMGKSTLAKYLCFLEANYLSLEGGLQHQVPILIKLSELAAEDNQRFSWKDVVRRSVVFREVGFTDKEADEFLQWISDNESKIFFILDGLDEFKYSLTYSGSSFQVIDKQSESSIQCLVMNLVAGKIFAKSKLLLTSRPYAVYQLHGDLRPQKVVEILGLNESQISTMVGYICPENFVSKIRSTLNDNYTAMAMCSNPVILQFVVAAELTSLTVEKDDSYKTTTKILMNILLSMRTSNYVGITETHKTYAEIASLCYQALIINNHRFVFKEELDKLMIDMKDLFFLRAKLSPNKFGNKNQIVVDNRVRYEFTASKWLELFVAFRIMLFLPRKTFKKEINSFCRKINNLEIVKLCVGLTSIAVRQDIEHVFGSIDNEELTFRSSLIKDIVVKAVRERTSRFFKFFSWLASIFSSVETHNLLTWISFSLECGDEELAERIAYYIPQKFTLDSVYIGPVEAQSLKLVLKKIPATKVMSFSLISCGVSQQSLSQMLPGIQHFASIQLLDLSNNQIGGAISDLARVVGKTKEVKLVDCGIAGKYLSAFCLAIEEAETPLESVDLSSNQIGITGIMFLKHEVLGNIAKELRLDDCESTDDLEDIKKESLDFLQKQINLLDSSKLKIFAFNTEIKKQ